MPTSTRPVRANLVTMRVSANLAPHVLAAASTRGGEGPGDGGFALGNRGIHPAKHVAEGNASLGDGGPLGSSRRPVFAGDGGGPLGVVVRGLGWHPDLPDRRDHTLDHPAIRNAIPAKLHDRIAKTTDLPTRIDLRGFFAPVDDQGRFQTCTAHAVSGLVEYLYTRGTRERLHVSRLFLYKATRRLLGWNGDSGAYLRTTIKALATFGVPPESFWPYQAELLEEEPDGFLYGYAADYKAITYARLDPYLGPGDEMPDIVLAVRRCLAAGFPVAFGFPVYDSLDSTSPDVPLPLPNDRLVGGHAVLAVGYDDKRPVKGSEPGALLIRNSWGSGWGDDGHGFLPYGYVRQQLATDFWTVFEQSWIQEGQFEGT